MKIKAFISIFLLFTLAWVNINLFCFSHYHVDETGKILIHAHPFREHHPNPGDIPAHHSHTRSEFFLFSFIYQILSLFVFCFILSFIALHLNPVFKLSLKIQQISLHLIFKDISRRGPPVVPLFA